MNFYLDGKYSAFEELMHYYHINFKVSNISSGNMDLILSILAGIGLGCGMLFNGIFADISSKYFKIWGSKMFILCLVALVLFIIQVIFMGKSQRIKE